MVRGTPFKVDKAVYDRAKANTREEYRDRGWYYLTAEDEEKLFDMSIRCGYGLYNDTVHEENGEYIVTWERGDSCD